MTGYVAPQSLRHFSKDGTFVIKRFRTVEDCALEARWYEWLPDFCAELIAIDGPDLVTRRHPTLWELRDTWRDPMAVYDMLRRLERLNVHHRDVHLRNIVLVQGEPRLIDWYTAVQAECPVSYDLYGEPAGLERPEGHIDYQCWTTENRWSIREAWGVDVPATVD